MLLPEQMNPVNVKLCQAHDVWKNIGYSIASVGQMACRRFTPDLPQVTMEEAAISGRKEFEKDKFLKGHLPSALQIDATRKHMHTNEAAIILHRDKTPTKANASICKSGLIVCPDE